MLDFKKGINASRITASSFGVLGGILGLEHGIGEILHGNIAITTTVINAYTGKGLPFPFGVEPAMTIIPNYLITGILAVITGLIIMAWSAFFIHKKFGSIILYLLLILLLLVGGGFAPILFLILSGIAGFKIKSSFKLWNKTPSVFRGFLALLWPWFFTAELLMVPVPIIYGYLSGLNGPNPDPDVFVTLSIASGLTVLGLIILTVITAMAHDSLKKKQI